MHIKWQLHTWIEIRDRDKYIAVWSSEPIVRRSETTCSASVMIVAFGIGAIMCLQLYIPTNMRKQQGNSESVYNTLGTSLFFIS